LKIVFWIWIVNPVFHFNPNSKKSKFYPLIEISRHQITIKAKLISEVKIFKLIFDKWLVGVKRDVPPWEY